MTIHKDIRLKAVNDDDAIAEIQAVDGGDSFNLNGDLVTNGVARTGTDAFQQVTLVGTASVTGVTFTVTGHTSQRTNMSEDIVGGGAGSGVTTKNYFREVTSIVPDISFVTNVKVGWLSANGISSAIIPLNARQSPFNVSLRAVEVVTTSNTFTAQSSLRNPVDFRDSYSEDGMWNDITGLSGVSDPFNDANLNFPVFAVRVLINTIVAADEWQFQLIQGQNG